MSGYVQPDTDIEAQEPHASTSSAPMGNMASQSSANASQQSLWEQSSHPVALLFLFLWRSLAIATYLLSGFFSTGFVFSVRPDTRVIARLCLTSFFLQTVVVVLFLSADFWTVKNGQYLPIPLPFSIQAE